MVSSIFVFSGVKSFGGEYNPNRRKAVKIHVFMRARIVFVALTGNGCP